MESRSALAGHPRFVPHRLVAGHDAAVGSEDQETIHAPGEPPVMCHGQDRAFEGRKRILQRLRRMQVKVVCRLVEQEQGGAGQLEQEDLQPGLLAPESESKVCSAACASP